MTFKELWASFLLPAWMLSLCCWKPGTASPRTVQQTAWMRPPSLLQSLPVLPGIHPSVLTAARYRPWLLRIYRSPIISWSQVFCSICPSSCFSTNTAACSDHPSFCCFWHICSLLFRELYYGSLVCEFSSIWMSVKGTLRLHERHLHTSRSTSPWYLLPCR